MRARVDPLRERLLGAELASARDALATHGARELVGLADAAVRAAIQAQDERDHLLAQLGTAVGADRRRLLEGWLRATLPEPKALRRALRALASDDPAVFDAAVITERVARRVDGLERRAEALLVVAGAADSAPLTEQDAAPLLALATLRGRWSRRVQALSVLGWLLRGGAGAAAVGAPLTASLLRLAAPTEHRWVQVAAYAALQRANPSAALVAAMERFHARGSEDDFLVRAGLLRAFAASRPGAPPALLDLARSDPSVLVRITAAQAERRAAVLAEVARRDPSPKVRATACLRLPRRAGVDAVAPLCAALRTDAESTPVRAAGTALLALASRRALAAPAFGDALAALTVAAERAELPAGARTVCAALLLELDTLRSSQRELRTLRALAAALPPGSSCVVNDATLASADDETLARLLAVASTEDFGLGVTRQGRRLRLYRGETVRPALWRILFEVTHPGPTKRQSVSHATTRSGRGELRAPPGGLAEFTPTNVPGERVFIESAGGWGRAVPRVDDLLSACGLHGRALTLADSAGVTTVRAPSRLVRRLRARAALIVGFARWSELRDRSLRATEPDAQQTYVRLLESELGIVVRHTARSFDAGPGARPLRPPRELVASGARPVDAAPTRLAGFAAPLTGLVHTLRSRSVDLWRDLVEYATWRAGGHLPELALYAALVLVVWFLQATYVRHTVDKDRAAIPLVLGGWGTRGKSGTERLKAALLQGLGFENLVKTTGCEAMFIHSIPGVPASEVFLYRPYDKATVWEQRDVLRLGRRFDVRALLWECMALQPDLVNLLQQQWMRDDLSTITNAYPDHEDVQGPTGYDVASTIAEFVPHGARLFTTERQMLPLLADAASQRGTSVRAVGDLEVELLADDLLARFGHQEHPANIALVARLARHLGVPSFVAVAEMADNVVADLGALKTYPTVRWRGRDLSFTNGMGANDRAATLGNFERAGLAAIDPEREPGRWVVTVVNNRADRVSRSEVFARLLVEDVRARRHVLIGTNISGLLGFLEAALASFLQSSSPLRDLPDDPAARPSAAHARLDRALRNLAIGTPDAASFLAEAAACGWPALAEDAVSAALTPSAPLESYAESLAAVETRVGAAFSADVRPFAVESLARRRTVRALHGCVEAHLGASPAQLEAAFSDAYRAIFRASLVPLHDPSLSGDAIIERVAASVAPGAHASVIGVQNIKGTGLDFVYRWVSIGRVQRLLAELRSGVPATRLTALRDLGAHDDYGLVDATLALEAVRQARSSEAELEVAAFDTTEALLTRAVAGRAQKQDPRKGGPVARILRALVRTLDFADTVRRRSLARRVVDELVAGHISHATAARRMREIIERGKGK